MEMIRNKTVFPDPTNAKMMPELFRYVFPLALIGAGAVMALFDENISTGIDMAAAVIFLGIGFLLNGYRRLQQFVMWAVFTLVGYYILTHPDAIVRPFDIMSVQLIAAMFIFKPSALVFRWGGKMVAVIAEVALVGQLAGMEPLYYANSEMNIPGMSLHMAIILTMAGYWVNSKGITELANERH